MPPVLTGPWRSLRSLTGFFPRTNSRDLEVLRLGEGSQLPLPAPCSLQPAPAEEEASVSCSFYGHRGGLSLSSDVAWYVAISGIGLTEFRTSALHLQSCVILDKPFFLLVPWFLPKSEKSRIHVIELLVSVCVARIQASWVVGRARPTGGGEHPRDKCPPPPQESVHLQGR